MTTPILTTVNTSYLECTVHSTKYHCLIKLRSCGGPAIAAEKTSSTTPSITNDDATITAAITSKGTTNGTTTTDNDDRVIKPDISSLVVVPIRTRRLHIGVEDERCVKRSRGHEKNDIIDSSSMIIIPLLPKLYSDTDCNATNNDDNGGILESSNHRTNNNDTTGAIDEDHPCYELVTIAHKLQDQLKERLTDASNGAAADASADTATSSMIQNNTRHRREGGISSSATMQEEFLLKSEAIIMELFSTIQQQLLRRKRSGVDHHHHQQRGVSKRQTTAPAASSTTYKAAMKKSSVMSSTTIHHHHSPPPPPLKYYSALSHQLHILQSLSSITDISLHQHDGDNSNNKNNADVTSLSITCHDNSMRCHMWHVELYPHVVLTVDLPVEFGIENIVNSSISSNNSINNNSSNSKNNDNNNKRPIRLERWWEDDNDNNQSPTTTSSDDSTATATAPTTLLLLPRIQQCFEITINKYQSLFNELDDIDANFWILEPTLPSRRCNVERRIALWEGGASLVIVLDPEYPRSVPVLVRFLGLTMSTMKAAASAGCGQGVTSAIGKNGKESLTTVNTGNNSSDGIVDWRVSFAEFISEEDEKVEEKGSAERGIKKKTNNLQQYKKHDPALDSNGTTKTTIQKHKWSDERSVRENLELWFGSSLPSPLVASTTDKSDFLVECGICYTHRLPSEEGGEEGPLPEIKCNNPSCSRHYHESCLFEWLHSLPMARVSFDRIFGSCMYCCEQISCPIAQQA